MGTTAGGRRRRIAATATLVSITALAHGLATPEPSADAPTFNRDVRPILSDACFACHGPDAAARLADLRLDTHDGATFARASGAAIVPGDAAASLAIKRLRAHDPDVRMPPPESKKTLTDAQIETIARWIDAGAVYEPHWAYVPPRPVTPPDVVDVGWPRTPIDRFVLARLEHEGLAPASEAPRETLLRRVTFDLTGLPPTPEELDAFLADESPDAYERVLDRLLASPRYGERKAMAWLDVARYADTHGYHYDNEREMWPWRDWIIAAYNANMPFDRFTVEQLAGDLLPEATLAQRIATAFNRNHGISWEGGIIPEEYRLEYVADRVHTTATAWMGVTAQCARCHDHKFDPITQREYYALSAFFNTISEQGADGLAGNAAPLVETPVGDHATRLADLDASLADLDARWAAPRPEADDARTAWEAETAARWNAAWTVFPPFAATARYGATLVPQDDGSLFVEGPHAVKEVYEVVALTNATDIRALRLEAMRDDRLPEGGPGRASHANIVLSGFEVDAAPVGDPGAVETVRFVAAHADHWQTNFFVGSAIDGDPMTGWALNGAPYGEDRVALFVPERPFGFPGGTALRIRVRHESGYTQHAIGRLRLSYTTDADLAARLAPVMLGPWETAGPYVDENGRRAHATAFPAETDPAVAWTPRPDLADGAVHAIGDTDNTALYLRRTITAPQARRLRVGMGSDDAIRVWLNGTVVLDADAPRPAARGQDVLDLALAAGANTLLAKVTNYGGEHAFVFERFDDDALDPPLSVLTKLQRPWSDRSPAQRDALRTHHLLATSPAEAALHAKLAAARAERAALAMQVPTVMVMREMAEPRATHLLMRGRYDAPGETVAPAVPAILGALPADAPPNRLGLARWLTAPNHPLTARVAANRIWQTHFGRGLVETAEDFGVQGAPPSHPDLLDWLALEFVRSGWDVKAMHRLVARSATYRQSARLTPALRERDPANVLLARGPRFRLSAEMLRDAALSASGLLVERLGGPSVKPYQPAGLWEEVGSDFNAFSANAYVRGTGADLYRRSMYTFWKRTLPPPAMSLFDAPSREFCVVRRSRTNTPLQALALLNDPTYVEAARFLAQRMLTEPPSSAPDADRLRHGFRLVTGRVPADDEVALLAALLAEQRARFAADTDSVTALLGVGDGMHADGLDRTELAAWAIVGSTILNLDEAITRG